MRPSGSPVLCVDLGGTKIRSVLLTEEGQILSEDLRQTPAHEEPEEGLKALLGSMARTLAGQGLRYGQLGAISIGAPGPLELASGTLLAPPNLPRWREVPLRRWVEEQTGVETLVGNDANLGALGEHRYGAGRGTRQMVYVTLSTGIGGGIICDGRLYLGATGTAGEIGHMIVALEGPPCLCGNRGCLEAMASGTAIARAALEALEQQEGASSSRLAQHASRAGLSARDVFEAAEEGDVLAQGVLAGAATALGAGFASLVNAFDPELLVVGGGLSQQPRWLLQPAVAHLRRQAFQRATQAVRVERALLGDNAVIFGALALVQERGRG